jgi:hypothetical protein
VFARSAARRRGAARPSTWGGRRRRQPVVWVSLALSISRQSILVRKNQRWIPECLIGYAHGMSDSAYFEYGLVLPEERYLIEVQTRKSESGELRSSVEIEDIAKECLLSAVGEEHADQLKDVKPNPISESEAKNLTKVQELLRRPDSVVSLVE